MITRILAFLRRLFPGNAPEPEVTIGPSGLVNSGLVDVEFMRQSFRQGEAFDPLSAIIEES